MAEQLFSPSLDQEQNVDAEVFFSKEDTAKIIADLSVFSKNGGYNEPGFLMSVYPFQKDTLFSIMDSAVSISEVKAGSLPVHVDEEFYGKHMQMLQKFISNAKSVFELGRVTHYLRFIKNNSEMLISLHASILERADAIAAVTGETLKNLEDALWRRMINIPEYLHSLPDEKLIELVEQDKIGYTSNSYDAIDELQLRQHAVISELFELHTVEDFLINDRDLFLRRVINLQLSRGDFRLFLDAIQFQPNVQPEHDWVFTQAHYALSDVCVEKKLPTASNPDFLAGLAQLSQMDYLNMICLLVVNGSEVPDTFLEHAVDIVLHIITNCDHQDGMKYIGFLEVFIQLIVTTKNELASKIWDAFILKSLPWLRDTSPNVVLLEMSTIIRTVGEGFAGEIAADLEVFHKLLGVLTPTNENTIDFLNNIIFQMILKQPDRAQEFITLSSSYRTDATQISSSLQQSLLNSHSEEDQKKLLRIPAVRNWLLSPDGSLTNLNTDGRHAGALAQLFSFSKKGDIEELSSRLTEVQYDPSEQQFALILISDTADHKKESTEQQLLLFRALREKCNIQNDQKEKKYIYDGVKIFELWTKHQVVIAQLFGIDQTFADVLISYSMAHPHGFVKLDETLSLYTEILNFSVSAWFVKMFFEVTKSIDANKLWKFIRENYPASKLQEFTPEEFKRVIDFTDSMSNLVLPKTYRVFCSIDTASEVPKSAASLGVTELGAEGRKQLKARVTDLIEKILRKKLSIQEMRNPVVAELVRGLTRFDISQSSRSKRLETVLISVLEAESRGELEIALGYEEEVVRVLSTDLSSDEIEFTQESRSQFLSLQNTLLKAIDFDSQIAPQQMIAEVQQSMHELINQQISRVTATLAVNSEVAPLLKSQLASLEGIIVAMQKISTVDQLIDVLLASKQVFKRNTAIDSFLRSAILHTFVKKNTAIRGNLQEVSSARLSFEAMANLVELFEHTIIQEYLPKAFPDQNKRKALSYMFDVKGLRQELSRHMKNQEYGNTSTFLFKPDRGILGELSGYISDACWTSLDDIMVNNPKLTPIIILSNPESKKNCRVGGAFLLIEGTEKRTGKDVLIIRGNNPLENTLAGIDTHDYLDQVVAYSKRTAKRRKIDTVVIPLDQKGASSTNRQGVWDAYMLRYSNNPKIFLDSKNSKFNGYDISTCCVSIPIDDVE